MNHRSKRGAIAILAASATALTMAGGPLATAQSSPPAKSTASLASSRSPLVSGDGQHERKGYYDSRTATPRALATAATQVVASQGKAFDRFIRSTGPQGVVSIDPVTGTPRQVGRLDGFLTARSSAPAGAIALNYVTSHQAVFGLSRADMATFKLSNDYVDILGTHHISWQQYVHGVPVFGNGLKAHVTKDGRLISVQGSPIAGLAAKARGLSTSGSLSPAAARSAAVGDVGGTLAAGSSTGGANRSSWPNGDTAQRVWFLTSAGLRLGWSTYTTSGPTLGYQHVIDAQTGRVLFRRSTINFDNGDALVYPYYPGAARGGNARVVNFVQRGWIGRHAPWLKGNFVYAWSDVNDNNRLDPKEKTPLPGTKHVAQFRLKRFQNASKLCSPQFVCTWDPNTAYSWRANRKADVSNAFYLASNFHDYLKKGPIGFTARAGNFEAADGDPVLLQALDGANTAGGSPDGGHIDNANMNTLPDGVPPTMQMYLWHFPGTTAAQEPYLPSSGAFDPSVLYHEYTHGLSNRLVTDASGNGALDSIQAGSMGEAWSDYYAMDYLVTKGYVRDTRKDGQVREAQYVAAGGPFRTQPIDCRVHSQVARCVDVFGRPGGYTYGDFPLINGAGPEVHSSGEVWAQTLWDLRKRFGHAKADMIITRGMELSPPEPSMLDMRNAILQADKVAFGGVDQPAIWRVFAHRGMGWYAGAIDGGDAIPAQDFHTPPPAQTPRATLIGRVVDPVTGNPIPNALVSIAGHNTGYVGDYSAVTGANGIYQMPSVLPGTYKKVVVFAPGYEVATTRVKVKRNASHVTVASFAIRRDWAAASGGGAVVDFNGPDYSPACGPDSAIDLSQGKGWGSTTGDDVGTPTGVAVPKFIVIALPRAIDITAGTDPTVGRAFKVDPTATCGDSGSASTNRFRIDVSTNGTTWTTVKTGSFGTIEDPGVRFRYLHVASDQDASNVRFVRYWMLQPQVPDFSTSCPTGNFSGCQFMDTTEVEVFGTASP